MDLHGYTRAETYSGILGPTDTLFWLECKLYTAGAANNMDKSRLLKLFMVHCIVLQYITICNGCCQCHHV